MSSISFAWRTLLRAPSGISRESDAAFWVAEALGRVVVERYLADGLVRWRRIGPAPEVPA